jgi:histidine ammonia-lyase
MDASEHAPVTISEGKLTSASSSASPRAVDLSDDAMDRVIASRAVVDAALAGPTRSGLNTGLGHLRDQRLPRP